MFFIAGLGSPAPPKGNTSRQSGVDSQPKKAVSGIMRRVMAAFLLLSLLQICFAKDKRTCVKPEPVQDNKFHPGQVWQYKTRSGESESFLTVLKVESLPKFGTIIHVRVDNIRLKNCTGGPELDKIAHMPFAKDAIERSVTHLIKDNSDIPSFKDGYDEWMKACGGVYTITVAEVVEANQVTLALGSAANHNNFETKVPRLRAKCALRSG